MTLVVDSSAVVAGLVDSDSTGQWAEGLFAENRLAAPHLVLVEVANILRRLELAGVISADNAAMAYADLLDMPIALYPFEPFAARVWALRQTVTPYDAWYVALAESLDASLITLDEKLANAPGPQCSIQTP
ncbi:PIN domain-containing protein [soil metagenome]